MSDAKPTPDPNDPAVLRRKKLIGRLAVIGLLLLVCVYLVPMFMSLRR